MRRSQAYQMDESALQADVMRFMAIVAFCLIAILAMVRNVAPSPEQEQSPPDVVRAPLPVATELAPSVQPINNPKADKPTEAEKSSTPATNAGSPGQAQPVALEIQEPQVVFVSPETEIEPEPEPEPKPEPVPKKLSPRYSSPTTAAQTVQQSAPAPTASEPKSVVAQSKAIEDIQASSPSTQDDEPGLTLRFASQKDFLRLVAKGRVSVHAYSPATFLSLTETYEFVPSTPPTQVYEMQTDTIPQHLRNALAAKQNIATVTWAVGLPEKIQQQIQSHLHHQESGALLINRYEEVNYEPLP